MIVNTSMTYWTHKKCRDRVQQSDNFGNVDKRGDMMISLFYVIMFNLRGIIDMVHIWLHDHYIAPIK